MAKKFDTRLIHGKHADAPDSIGVSTPIEMSTTFIRDDPRDTQGFIYSRANNPTRLTLEHRIASLENGVDAVAFATGSAASLAVFQALPKNSHILVTHDAYYGTVLQLREFAVPMGHTVTAIDTTDKAAFESNWQSNTRLVWLETPSNPQMRISDIAWVADFAHQRGAKLCCDNTLATSLWQQPLELGADFSMHSSTKFFGGHSDVMGGVVIAKEASSMLDRIRQIQAVGGATPAVFDCWLLLRSIATLGVRVRQQTKTAAKLAEHLSKQAKVEAVLYAGHPNHPQRDLINRQMAAGGSMMSLLIRGTEEDAIAIARGTKLIKQATSLGGIETLIEHRKSVEGPTSVSPANLLRLSVGLEDVDDLLEDLTSAMKSGDSLPI